jgi:hypothetical protein
MKQMPGLGFQVGTCSRSVQTWSGNVQIWATYGWESMERAPSTTEKKCFFDSFFRKF